MGGVWQTARRPRWLALLAVVLLAAVGMARLGQWQLARAREQSAQAQRQRQAHPPRPLLDVLRARQPFTNGDADQPVVAQGRWDGARQVLVTQRPVGGVPGYWVLTPLLLDDGSAVAVVRGWVAEPPAPAAVPSPPGRVQIAGVLQPGEPAVDRSPGQTSGLPAGQIDRVDLTELIQRWPYPLLTGYVVMTGQSPRGSPGLGTVPVVLPGPGLAWRNLSYAVQWWVFAAFGLFLWWRLVRDDHLDRLGRRTGPSPEAAGGDPPAPGEVPMGNDEASPAADVRGART